MQAIQSHYLCPTNTLGARIKATCERGSITLPHPQDLSDEDAHRWAVSSLVSRFIDEDADRYGSPPKTNPWGGPRACGVLPDGSYAHVFLPREEGK